MNAQDAIKYFKFELMLLLVTLTLFYGTKNEKCSMESNEERGEWAESEKRMTDKGK